MSRACTWLGTCLTLTLLSTLACSPVPRPPILDQSKATAESDALSRARRLAPQAYAHAEGVRESAEQAHSEGHPELASALAGRALVAFERAAVQAQKVEATERIALAEQASRSQRVEIGKLVNLQEAIAAETKRLELRVDIETNTLARTPLGAEVGQRAEARAEAARSIAEAARLLCVAARLVAPSDAEAETTSSAAETLLSELATLPPHQALDRAMDQRVRCLTVLSRARRGSTQRAPDAGDELLGSLSPSFAELRPHRDDRGVVLTALGAWDGKQLTPTGRDIVDRVSKLSAARPYPLMVVLHPTKKPGTQSPQAASPSELEKLLPKAAVVQTTTTLPSLLELPAREKQGGRMEFIFITP